MDTRRWALELDNLKGKTLYFLNNEQKAKAPWEDDARLKSPRPRKSCAFPSCDD